MKLNKKVILVIIVFIMVIMIFGTEKYSANIQENKNLNTQNMNKKLTKKQKAIVEVANAYWRKDSNIQYESMKRNYLVSPEAATKDDILNTTCHAFAYQIYKQAFNIEIPKGCSEIFEYCKIKKNTEYVPIFYSTEDFKNTSDDYKKESEDYKKLLMAFYEGNNENDKSMLKN